MRFRGRLFAAALSTAVLAGVLKAAFFDRLVLTWSAVLLVMAALGVAAGVTFFADMASHRLWKPTRDTVRETTARKEALAGAVAMAAMFSVYGWTSSVLAGQPMTPITLTIDAAFFLLAVTLIYTLYRHLSTR